MRPRAALLLVLLLSPALAGCAADDERPRLAQPTDAPVELPGRNATAPRAPTGPPRDEQGRPLVDFRDPGYVIEGAWSVGDTWRYESNHTPPRYRTVRVVDLVEEDGRRIYVVEEEAGRVGQGADAVATTRIDADNWTRLRTTDPLGTRILYDPPAGNVRLHRNGSASWNETGTNPYVGSWKESRVVNSYYAGIETLDLGWARVRAGRIEHRDFVTDAEGTRGPTLTLRWVDRSVLNEVAYESGGARYVLVGASVGGRGFGAGGA